MDNFILHSSYKYQTDIRWSRFVWLQSNSGFTVLYRKSRTKEKKKYIKVSLGVDVLKKIIICTVKIRRTPARHDNIDFRDHPSLAKARDIKAMIAGLAIIIEYAIFLFLGIDSLLTDADNDILYKNL